MKTANILSIFVFIITAAVTRAQMTNLPSQTSYSVISMDGNSEILQQTGYKTSPTGRSIPQVRSVTRIATGLNYWDGAKWDRSDPTFQVSADGNYVYANKLQTKIRLSANLAASNSVSITTPDDIVLSTAPVAVGLYDAVSGNSLIVAAITNCTGTLINSNEVLYENAFNGISGSILYTLKRDSFSQDVIWTQNIDPADYGFPTNSTRIQIFTAFNSPMPKQITRALYVETNQTIRAQMASPDLIDHTLKFGQLKFGPGRAFSTTSTNRLGGAPVAKDFETINGQSYLIESLDYSSIRNYLESLPRVAVSARSKLKVTKNARNHYVGIPVAHSTAKATIAVKLPQHMLAAVTEPKGVVSDYVALDGGEPEPMIFQGDTTYFVSGEVDCDDVIFEGGAVIKYAPGTDIQVEGNLTCETTQYLPAIFTAADDDSVGQSMNGIWSGYTGTIQPGGYAASCLMLFSPSPVENCRFCYSQQAVESLLNQSTALYDCQIVNCVVGLNPVDTSFTLENCLIADVTNLVSGSCSLTLLNCTVDNCMTLFGSEDDDSLYATNSIFSDIDSLTNSAYGGALGLYGGNNGFYDAPAFGSATYTNAAYPFETVGAGNYYLADNTFRSKGTANMGPAILADLAQKTTWPPIVYDATNISSLGTLGPRAPRDTNSAPDLGYHYPGADYMFAGCDLETNLIVAAGTAIGFYDDYDTNGILDSITLNDGANLSFDGTATQPCIFARQTMVQENGQINWTTDTNWTSGAITFNGSGNSDLEPRLSANFTKWTSDNWNTSYTGDRWAAGEGSLANCEFYNAGMITYDMQNLYFTNCLFFRALLTFWDQVYALSFTFENCTFYDGCLFYGRYNGIGTPYNDAGLSSSFWQIENCSFDGTALVWWDPLDANPTNTLIDYNSYNTNNLSWQTYPYAYPPVYGTNEVVGPDDLIVTNYNWQTNWFGNFYLPSDSLLIQRGSTNANFLGLYEFTTQTNQVADGTNLVDIGYHYIATDANGNPLDTYFPGVPNYIVDSQGNGMDTNGLPYWWEGKYFGQVGLNTNSDPDNSGVTLLYDYQNGIDPNVIAFTISVTNSCVNTELVPVQLDIQAGIPDNIAVVDSTNFIPGAETWYPYASSNIVVNLAATEGQHDIWVGLKGLPSDATVTWQEVTLTLQTNSPLIVVTNPAAGTVSDPMIQVQGFANENLSSITYDVSNATGMFSNQSGYLMGSFYDTNSIAITEYDFQFFDVSLATGLNTVTIHATDLAGNTMTTNVNFTLDYSAATNPPALNIIWPQNGTAISGSSFTLHAQVDNALDSVTATIVDPSGNTNVVIAPAQRNENVRADGLPLAAGTNILTVTAINAAGLSVTTNLAVTQSAVMVTMDPLSSDQFNQTSVNVTGTINVTNDSLTVNGVQAEISSNGTWSASNVLVSATGRAVFDLEVWVGDPTDTGSRQITLPQPPTVTVSSYSDYTQDWTLYAGCTPEQVFINFYWVSGVGGVLQDGSWGGCGTSGWTNFGVLGPDWDDGTQGSYYSRRGSEAGPGFSAFMKETAIQPLELTSGGEGQPGTMQVYLLMVEGFDNSDGSNLPPQSMTFQGQTLQDSGVVDDYGGHWGLASLQRPAGADVNSSISAPSTNYYYSGQPYQLVSQCEADCPADQNRTNIGVGELVDLFFNPALPTNITTVTWSTTAGGLLVTNGFSSTLVAPSNATNVTVTATVGNFPLNISFQVYAPTGYVSASIASTETFGEGISAAEMFLDPVVLGPTDVSFDRVWFEEVGEDAINVQGYYVTNPPPSHSFAGANNWFRPGTFTAANSLPIPNTFQDECWATNPPPWSDGSFTWPIPVAWEVADTPSDAETNMIAGWKQVFLIDSSGTATIQKFGHSVTRTIQNITTTQ